MKNAGRYYRLLVVGQGIALILLLVARIDFRGWQETPIRRVDADVRVGLKTALEMFRSDYGRYPTTQEGWTLLVIPPTDASRTNWHGPYFDPPAAPVDPWGHEYVYRCPGVFNTNSYDLYSLGPDGVENTADDIGNWQQSSGREIVRRKPLVEITPDELLLAIPLLFVVGILTQLTFPNVRQVARESEWADWLWFALAVIALIMLVTPRISG